MTQEKRSPRGRGHRREDLIDAAEAVFSTGTFESATVDTIAQRCGVAKGTVYRYFKTKQDLYLAVAARGMQTLLDMLNAVPPTPDGRRQLEAYLRVYARFSLEQRPYFDAFCFFNAAEVNFSDPSPALADCMALYAQILGLLHGALTRGAGDQTLAPLDDATKTVALLAMATTGFLDLLARRTPYLQAVFDDDFDGFFAVFMNMVSAYLTRG